MRKLFQYDDILTFLCQNLSLPENSMSHFYIVMYGAFSGSKRFISESCLSSINLNDV